MLNVDLQLFIV